MAKALKSPFMLESASCVPLFCIVAFSLFVVWQWSSQPRFDSIAIDRAMFLPSDEVSTLSSIQGPKARPDAARRSVNNSDLADCCRCPTGELMSMKTRNKLLHNWTDSKLFNRTIKVETGKIARECSLHDDSLLGLKTSETSIVPDASISICDTPCTKRPKIAFLFMITTSLPFEPLWQKYFEGHEELYNIYVHADPFNAGLFNETDGVFFRRLIPSKKAFRGSPSLVLASNRLVANAMLDDPSNMYFVLLSGHCIPVRSFDFAYNVLTASRQSFVEQIVNESVMWERYTGREGGEELMLPEITFDQFRKAAQWFVFTRKHALMILKDVRARKYWGKFDHECLIYFCGTDEHYYPTVLHILDPEGVSGTSVTYVQWPDYVSEHPVLFKRDDVSREFIMAIQQRNDGQYLFARKFEEDTLDLLMDLVGLILS